MWLSDPRLLIDRTGFSRRFWHVLSLTGGVCAAWLAFAACASSQEPGMELTITMAVAPRVAGDGSILLPTDTGYTVKLERAYLSLGALEILGCDEPGGDALLRRWLGPKPAFAHTPSGPTRIGEPVVVTLLADTPADIGALLPPPGDYCETHVEFQAADADARGLPADVDMVGATLDVAGTWSDADGSGQEFALRTSTSSARELEQVFSLSRDERQQTLGLRAIVDGAFDGVDFAEQTESEQAETVLFNLSRRLEVGMQ
jgi:hypothetical protein